MGCVPCSRMGHVRNTYKISVRKYEPKASFGRTTWTINTEIEFYVLLTVHLCIILYIKPNWCIIFLRIFIFLSISMCFRRLWAHHQEIQQSLCDTWYLLFCVDGCMVCRVKHFVPPCIPYSQPHRITSTKCRINSVVSPDDGPIVARNT